MSAKNSCTFVGNLTRDPEGRTVNTKNGENRVLNFSIGVNGRKDRPTLFVECTAWGQHAEYLEKYARKGHTIAVDAEMYMDSWEDKETGSPRKAARFDLRDVSIVGSPKGGDQPAAEEEAPPAPDANASKKGKSAKTPKAPKPPVVEDEDGEEEGDLSF